MARHLHYVRAGDEQEAIMAGLLGSFADFGARVPNPS
jgi:hypothetical protein